MPFAKMRRQSRHSIPQNCPELAIYFPFNSPRVLSSKTRHHIDGGGFIISIVPRIASTVSKINAAVRL
jgi:hypothetical protein